MAKGSKRKRIEKQIGEYIKKLSPKELQDLFLFLGVTFYGARGGYRHFRSLEGIFAGAVTSNVSFKLATSNNLPGGLSGVAGLAAIGLTNIGLPVFEDVKIQPEEWWRVWECTLKAVMGLPLPDYCK